MKIFAQTIFFFLILYHSGALCQRRQLKKAAINYEQYEFANAISMYESAASKGVTSLELFQKLGDCYYFNSNLKDAAKWYKKMINTGVSLPSEYYIRAVQSLKHLEKYEDAHQLMNILSSVDSKNPSAKRFLNNPLYLEKIARQSGRYTIANLTSNSVNQDFAPSFYKDQLVFSSSRVTDDLDAKKSTWANKPYLKIYGGYIETTGQILHPLEFAKELNLKFHKSTSSFTNAGTTIYFTTNNNKSTMSPWDSLELRRLKIVKADLNEQGAWGSLEELSFNNDSYSAAHPALNPDNNKLYFASDMPGGYGLSDIYVVDILEDKSLSEPRNMGPVINTEGRDTFPFISKDGKLYFASDGHLGLGGFDIFVTNLIDKEKKVFNVGKPINSTSDDITFIINDKTKKGYFSSNRSGGKGDDDVYMFEEITPLLSDCSGLITGTIRNQNSNKIVTDVNIEVKTKSGVAIYNGKTNNMGTFSLPIDCGNITYDFLINKEGFAPIRRKIKTTPKKTNLTLNISITNLTPLSEGINLIEFLDLEPIYFKPNKSDISKEAALELDRIVDYLKRNPLIEIEIRSHTDSKGSDRYNLKLSDRRAIASASYIMNKGIESERVKSKGYGETLLKNNCSNGISCSSEKHKKNRRSEFVVIKN